MTINRAMTVSSSAMSVERYRMDVIATNLANANSMSANGVEAYRRRNVIVAGDQGGVRILDTVPDEKPLIEKYDPSNPFADAEGNVTFSNVDPVTEMVDMMGAGRAYEANVAAFNAAKSMLAAALQIGKI